MVMRQLSDIICHRNFVNPHERFRRIKLVIGIDFADQSIKSSIKLGDKADGMESQPKS
jgi:hypothetical protein